MTYKKQMEKAIKEYLAPYGFKYSTKHYAFVKKINEDMTQWITWAGETHFRKQYYFLRTSAVVSSNLLYAILAEVTNGLTDFRCGYCSPAYLTTLDGKNVIHTEFIGERSMEDNIPEFDQMFKQDINSVFDKFSTTKSVILSPIKEPFFNPYNTPNVFFYVPLAYYFNGEFNKALEYIDERLEICKATEPMILSRYGVLGEEDINERKAYILYKENLKKWIAEGRQFKIDNEYLPITDQR